MVCISSASEGDWEAGQAIPLMLRLLLLLLTVVLVLPSPRGGRWECVRGALRNEVTWLVEGRDNYNAQQRPSVPHGVALDLKSCMAFGFAVSRPW